jgi:hypothetical protein
VSVDGGRAVQSVNGVNGVNGKQGLGGVDDVDDVEGGRAEALLTLAFQAWQAGLTVDPAQALPVYVRDKVASTTAEREAAALAKAAAAQASQASQADQRAPERRR